MPNPFEQLRRQKTQFEIMKAKTEAEAHDRKLRLLRGDMSALPDKEIKELSKDEPELSVKTTKNILRFISRKSHK